MKRIQKFVTADGRIPFDEWINSLDVPIRARIRAYIDRVAMGGARYGVKRLHNADGILEIRIDAGPGYRVYFGEIGNTLLLLLMGGSKRGQVRDISLATQYWRER